MQWTTLQIRQSYTEDTYQTFYNCCLKDVWKKRSRNVPIISITFGFDIQNIRIKGLMQGPRRGILQEARKTRHKWNHSFSRIWYKAKDFVLKLDRFSIFLEKISKKFLTATKMQYV